jgi:hypothetical protein
MISKHGIYMHRWGDAPLRYLTHLLFFRGVDKDCWLFCNINYGHGRQNYDMCDYPPHGILPSSWV